MKQCSKCKETKALSEFNKRSKSPDGLGYMCRPCNNNYSKRFQKDNPNYTKEYYDSRREEFKILNKQYYESNIEIGRARNRNWYKANTEKAKAYNKSRTESKKEGHFSIYLLEGTQGVYGKGYVGQTGNLYYRISHHKHKGKIFDRYTILDTAQTEEEALYLEAQYHVIGYGGEDQSGSKLREQIIKENKLKLNK